jgi:hypothetical protein
VTIDSRWQCGRRCALAVGEPVDLSHVSDLGAGTSLVFSYFNLRQVSEHPSAYKARVQGVQAKLKGWLFLSAVPNDCCRNDVFLCCHPQGGRE